MTKSKEELISDLSSVGVMIENDICTYSLLGKKISQPLAVAKNHYSKRIEHNSLLLNELWNDLIKMLQNYRYSNSFESSDMNQNMFINALRHMYSYSIRYKLSGKNLIRMNLSLDSYIYDDKFIIDFIDNFLCLEWVYGIIKLDIGICSVLEKLCSTDKEASGSMGHVDLKMNERVFPESEFRDDGLEHEGMLHPLYTRKFRQYDLQNGFNVYDIEDRVYRAVNNPYKYLGRDERGPNKQLSRNTSPNSDVEED